MKSFITFFKIVVLVFLFQSCSKEEALPVKADFEFEVFNNDFSVPVEIIIFNATKGADNYQWSFEGAVPQVSTQRNPGVITYNAKGSYTITLKATNEDGSQAIISRDLVIEDPIKIDFSVNPKIDFFSPSTINITNTTKGADTFKWTFEGGIPKTSTNQNPSEVIFTEPGIHKVILEASNGFETQALTKEIEVLPLLEADFDFEVSFEDDDLQVPVMITIANKSTSATNFSWEFTGASATISKEENPEIVFDQSGVQTITLTATNGKQSKTITKQIEVFENTNLRILRDVKLGINTSHNNNVIGAAYDLDSRKVFTRDQITMDNGEEIDFLFFGLNNRFTRNVFTSPDNLGDTTFLNIANANSTLIINNLEGCSCGVSLSPIQFDAMTNDDLLSDFSIVETTEGNLPFDGSIIPRVVVFKTTNGRKGAIKINDFVDDSTNSFIEIDIKIQKEAR
mgnify:CR=1 FL=1